MSTRATGRSRGARAALLVASAVACAPQRGTIGAVLGQSPQGRVHVRETPAGLGAARAGVAVGDEVLLIDGRAADAMTSQQIHQALSGEVGETVKLTLLRDDRVVRLSVRRTPARKTGPEPAPDGAEP